MIAVHDFSERPFVLPLDRGQFEAALRNSHGRAFMHVKQYGASGVEDLIVDACLHDKRFDPQCECGRVSWMADIVEAAGLDARVCKEVVAALRADPRKKSSWDTNHLCGLALALAQQGHGLARSALYSALRPCDGSANLVAAEEIIALDGADGLLFVADRIGHWISERPDMQVGDDPLLWYDEHHGPGCAERVLSPAAESDVHIAAYMSRIRHVREDHGEGRGRLHITSDILRCGAQGKFHRDRMRTISADDVIGDIEALTQMSAQYAFSSWGRHAAEDDLQRVADRMFSETDAARLVKFLEIFRRRPLPQFDVRLLRFAEHSDGNVRWVATFVLANHRHPAVRALAQDRVRAGRHSERELLLFRENFQLGDWALIRDSLSWPNDINEVHGILSDLLDVYASNLVDELVEALFLVYENSPCAICRSLAVKSLLTTKQAPAWLVEECRFDADEEIRLAAAEASAMRMGESSSERNNP